MNTLNKSYIETLKDFFKDTIDPIVSHIINDLNLNNNKIHILNYEEAKDTIDMINEEEFFYRNKILPWVCLSSHVDNKSYVIIYSIESNTKQFYILYNQNICSYDFIKVIIIGLVHEFRHVYQIHNNLFDSNTQEGLMETDAEMFAGNYFEYNKEYFNLHIQYILNKYSKLI